MQATEQAIRDQYEQERSMDNEIDAYRRDIFKEQVRGEHWAGVLKKIEAQADFLQDQNGLCKDKQSDLQVR